MHPRQLKLGSCFCLALLSDNILAVWGNGGPGVPKSLKAGKYNTFKPSYPISHIDACSLNASAITRCGKLLIWGKNHHNMYGIHKELPFVDTPSLLNTSEPI
ncbi:hypothetical protein HZS_5012, partial [Henneguya salminicola]